MIKKCKVLLRNSVNMVIEFDGNEVQMPTDNSKDKEIFIGLEDGRFTVETQESYDKITKVSLSKPKKKFKEESDNETKE